jgi:hypothetical protein
MCGMERERAMDQKRIRPLAATGVSASTNSSGIDKSNAGLPQAKIYVVRLTSPRGDDIRRLRWALKGLLRRLGLRCLSIEEEARR